MAYRKTSGAPGTTSRFAPEIKTPQQAEQEAQELLASFGSRILEMLKAGGQKLDNFDRAYANRMFDTTGSEVGVLTRAYPLTEPIAANDYEFAGGFGPRTNAEQMTNNVLSGVSRASNIASRYALPAGGVMLAGKGLADLTNGLYDVASDTPIL
jgi:hypothetical protein